MFGKFSVIRDEEGPQVAFIAPSPITVFESLEELKEWLDELVEVVAEMTDDDLKSSEVSLKQAYASQVIDEWQNLLQKTQKSNGTEK